MATICRSHDASDSFGEATRCDTTALTSHTSHAPQACPRSVVSPKWRTRATMRQLDPSA
ncbi:MAG: hypothetical protein U0183_23250 [Polyangiaceae bacterium]